MKERLIEFLSYLGVGQSKFEKKVHLSSGFVNKVGDSIREKNIEKIIAVYPELNVNWLKTGEGKMLKDEAEPCLCEVANYVPLLPISAQGGRLNDFVISVKDRDCEKVISPIKGADFAMTVAGDSMSPEYPSGSQLLIKKINERAFIEWGKVYVLDTCNGSIIKEVHQGNNDDEVICVSINQDPKYKPFSVKLNDIYGMYKVLLCMSIK